MRVHQHWPLQMTAIVAKRENAINSNANIISSVQEYCPPPCQDRVLCYARAPMAATRLRDLPPGSGAPLPASSPPRSTSIGRPSGCSLFPAAAAQGSLASPSRPRHCPRCSAPAAAFGEGATREREIGSCSGVSLSAKFRCRN